MKMRIIFLLVVSVSAMCSTSCGPSAPVRSAAVGATEISKLDEQWSATAAKNDLAGTVAFYADDAVLLAPNSPIATDAKSIRESWASLLGPNTAVSWKVTKAEVAQSGELGYLYGTYTVSVKDPKGGPPVNETGKLVEIWKKQADGKWKCAVDTYNSDQPIVSASKAAN
jgi:ketosteroid isomerase-like protein